MVQDLIDHYGYLAVFAGTLLEGETILVMAGFAAHRGFLALHWVIVVAAAGGFLGDQLWFYLGSRHGSALLARFPLPARSSAKIQALLSRYDAAAIFAVRFLYGLRLAGPILIGASGVGRWRFFWFNLLGAAVWAATIGAAGYLFGAALENVLQDLDRYEIEVLLLMAACGMGIGLWYWLRNRCRRT